MSEQPIQLSDDRGQLNDEIGTLPPTGEALVLAETLVNHQWGVSVYRLAVALDNFRLAGLRAALPWEPSAEAVEAMAYARTSPYLPIKSEYTDAARIYRAQPIMRELYPEHFGESTI